jgi:hypothetical protein
MRTSERLPLYVTQVLRFWLTPSAEKATLDLFMKPDVGRLGCTVIAVTWQVDSDKECSLR